MVWPPSANPPYGRSYLTIRNARFCIGRDIHGLPLGTIVHAGRHQFAHWKDEYDKGYHLFTRAVFTWLNEQARHIDPLMDLVYDLGSDFYFGHPIRASSLVLTTIGWTKYEAYVADMRQMLEGIEP